MIFEVDPSSLDAVREEMEIPETNSKVKYRGKVAKPSRLRCETGAIEGVGLWGKSEKLNFTAEEAIEWFKGSTIGGRYEVTLFHPLVIGDSEKANLDDSHKNLQSSFVQGLRNLDLNAEVVLAPEAFNSRLLLIGVIQSAEDLGTSILEHSEISGRKKRSLETNLHKHEKLLEFLSQHPLIKRVELPPAMVHSK